MNNSSRHFNAMSGLAQNNVAGTREQDPRPVSPLKATLVKPFVLETLNQGLERQNSLLQPGGATGKASELESMDDGAARRSFESSSHTSLDS